ncbi:MAG: hypothetical protein ACP5SI_11550, partial [Chloroflexia bacterium]
LVEAALKIATGVFPIAPGLVDPVCAVFHVRLQDVAIDSIITRRPGKINNGAELPGLIEAYLAAGGVGLPDSPCLQKILRAASIDFCQPGEESCTADVPAVVSRPSGFGLAVAVLAAMIGALALGGVLATCYWWTERPRPTAHPRRLARSPWTGWIFLLLNLAGLAVGGYLAYVEMCDVPAVCGPVGDCNAVQQSKYAPAPGLSAGWAAGPNGLHRHPGSLAFLIRCGARLPRWVRAGDGRSGLAPDDRHRYGLHRTVAQ